MLQNKLFSDIQIGFNSEKHFNNETNLSQRLQDFPDLIHSHKSILKVRAPAFYKHLLEHKEPGLGPSAYNSYLEESELKDFLKYVLHILMSE